MRHNIYELHFAHVLSYPDTIFQTDLYSGIEIHFRVYHNDITPTRMCPSYVLWVKARVLFNETAPFTSVRLRSYSGSVLLLRGLIECRIDGGGWSNEIELRRFQIYTILNRKQ